MHHIASGIRTCSSFACSGMEPQGMPTSAQTIKPVFLSRCSSFPDNCNSLQIFVERTWFHLPDRLLIVQIRSSLAHQIKSRRTNKHRTCWQRFMALDSAYYNCLHHSTSATTSQPSWLVLDSCSLHVVSHKMLARQGVIYSFSPDDMSQL